MESFPNKWVMLGSSVALCEVAGIAAGSFAGPEVTGLAVGASNLGIVTPDWILGPALTAAYVLAGVALYLVWQRSKKPGSGRAIELFALQLALGVVWSAFYFGFKMPALALAGAALMIIVALATIAEFWRLDNRAAVLLLPYLAWAAFAAFVNFKMLGI